MNNDIKLQALEYQSDDMSVFPLQVKYDNNNKKEVRFLFPWDKYKKELISEEEVQRLCDSYPQANMLGMATGKVSDVTVIDIDTDKTTGKLKADASAFPDTYTVQTQSGGIHLYYKYSPNIKQGQGIKTTAGIVDVRNDGGMVIMPTVGDNHYKVIDSQSKTDAPLDVFVSQSPSSTYKYTNLDDVIYMSEHPTLQERNLTLFNYFFTELRAIANENDFPAVLENVIFALKDIKTSEPRRNIERTYASVKKLITKDRENQNKKEIRKEAQKESVKKVQLFFLQIEEHLLRDFPVYRVYNGNCIYRYNGAFYEEQTKEQMKYHIAQYLKEKNLLQYNKDNFHNEVYNRLITHLQGSAVTEVSDLVCVENGLFDIGTMTLTAHTSEVFTVNQLPFRYEKDVTEMPLFTRYLDTVSKKGDIAQMLQELSGYVIKGGNERQVVHMLFGQSGNNGKSVFWKILAKLLGQDNIATIPLEAFGSQNDFRVSNIVNKKLIISDETTREYLKAPLYTELTSGGSVTINPKHKDTFTYTPKGSFLISGNYMPKFSDATGMKRRLVIIPFNYQIKESEKVLKLEEKIQQANELPAIFNWALEGIKRVEESGFKMTDKALESKGEYETLINPVLDFITDSEYVEWDPEYRCTYKELYGSNLFRGETGYNKFTSENGKKSLDFKNFKMELQDIIATGKLPEYVEYNKSIRVGSKVAKGIVGLRPLTENDDDF